MGKRDSHETLLCTKDVYSKSGGFLDSQRSSSLPKEKSHIFFCYSRADGEFALKLAKDLRQAGANIWLDQLDVPAGECWDMVTEEALINSDRLLAILSPTAVQSQNVRDELHYALEENKKIVPVLFQQCPIPYSIRRFQYIDFTIDYEKGLKQLFKTLNLKITAPTETTD